MVPPRPLDYDDFEFLLTEITQLGNKYATDWALQRDRHSAFLAQMQSLHSAIEKQTTLALDTMSAITTLRSQMQSTLKVAVEAQDCAQAVQLENITLRASLQDLQTPAHFNIPAAIAQTQATVLDLLATMGDDLARQMDTTIRTRHATLTAHNDDTSAQRWKKVEL